MPENIEPIDLMRRAKAGDANAFGQLYELYYVPVFRYLYGRLRNKDLTTDLTQNVFLKVYEAIGRIEPNDAPLRLFFTVARNTLIDHWRRKKEVSLINDEEDAWQTIPDNRPTQVAEVEAMDLSIRIRRALNRLNADDQEVVILKYYSGLSAKEISEQLGSSEAAIRQRQCRALKVLKELLQEYGE